MTIDLTGYLAFLLIMLRMTGVLVLNPILGRTNVPTLANMGLAFMMTLLLVNTVPIPAMEDPTFLFFLFMALKELAIGFIAGFFLRLFLSVIVVGGEIVDMQLGIAMSKVFDPSSNTSISLSASMYNVMFVLAFFITNNHLTFLSMSAQSFFVIPLGMVDFNVDALLYIPEYFASILIFAVKLCMPVVVVELVVTMAVGIIMRIIPQINVFVVNIQFKLLTGIFMLVVLVGPMMGYFENLITICFENIQVVWTNFILTP